jgi:phage tail-like protein
MPQAKNTISTTGFIVNVEGLSTSVGVFHECTGLELHFEVYEYREGGNNDIVHRLPGQLSYPNLVLSWGMTNNTALFEWFEATKRTASRMAVTVTLGIKPHTRSWTFADAFPVRWTGPQLSVSRGEIATETLEIAHGGLKPA